MRKQAKPTYKYNSIFVWAFFIGGFMKISKILNNNVVVINENNHEFIAMGRGLAFKKRVGDYVNQEKIDKKYILENQYIGTNNINPDILECAQEIIRYANHKLDKTLDDIIYVLLIEYIYMAIFHYNDGVIVKNNILWIIRRFYPEEFEIGEKAVEIINNKFEIELPFDEIAFFANAIHNVEINKSADDNVNEITELIKQIIVITENYIHDDLMNNSYYDRFIIHIDYLSRKILKNQTLENNIDGELYNFVKNKYDYEYRCVNEIDEYLKKDYQFEITNEEKFYLIMHMKCLLDKTDHK